MKCPLSAAAAAAMTGLWLAAAPLAALAQTPAAASDPAFAATTLNLSAYGEAKVTPDMATINLGVDTTAPTAARAMRANADQMARVVGALKEAGIEGRDLQTANLSLSPQYVYEENRPARLTGYQASNQLTVRVNDLARLGPVADAVIAAGATNVGSIAFGLANPVSAENTARIAAVKALQDKASLYAQAVGYHIQRLVNLTEGGDETPSPPRPMPMLQMRVAANAPTPVEVGELNVRVDVIGVFELAR
ncbi:MAG: SIMPL domain-containing protein [Caulobacteraceae bacterium]